ncbi:glycosyltransferase family 2 protein [Acidianus sp. RZ1]|uniref:glycosyltransferase n=1 Tax=Acidianus sp. RZ1 TaxID=1540082 RepID=UPI00149315D2|nr:glycosyltransferase family A protein [Acidianus sp. RZ1]NON63017.1 glycosyltransferase family 2 protein [Acidianus sp. RZ1]
MLLSVTMVAKNEEPVIDKAIKSILNILKYDAELILVDNYSKDNTMDIMNSFEDKERIRVYKFKGSKGLARNFALSQSRGKFVMALDGDQIYRPLDQFINIYIEKFNEYAVKLGRSSFPIIASKDLLLKIGGWRDLQFAEDWDLWFRLTDSCRYIFLPGYEWVFGDHIRKHKNVKNSYRKAIRNIKRYRDLYLIGVPVKDELDEDRRLRFLYNLGKILSISKRKLKANYQCVKYLEKDVPYYLKELDWDLRFQYNLLQFQSNKCKEPIFSEILERFEVIYRKI